MVRALLAESRILQIEVSRIHTPFKMMESFDDEMLFGADDDHDILLPTITDDNEQQSQLGSVMTHSRSRKRSRASSALSMSQTSGHEGGSIDDLIEQLPTPFSTAKTSKQDAKVVLILPAGKRDRYCAYQGAYFGHILSHLILLRIFSFI
jgi:hypothetical protein